MTVEQLAAGIAIAERDTSERLPTLGQFKAWCRTEPRDNYQPLPRLEHAAGRTPEGQRWLAFMRLEGLQRLNTEMTIEEAKAILADCDIEEMRERSKEHLARLQNL